LSQSSFKTIMNNISIKKNITLLLTVLLFISFYAEVTMIDICSCEREHSHLTQSKSSIRSNTIYTDQYIDEICNKCNIRDGQISKAGSLLKGKTNSRVLTFFIKSNNINYDSIKFLHNKHAFFSGNILPQSAPVYLSTLTIRC